VGGGKYRPRWLPIVDDIFMAFLPWNVSLKHFLTFTNNFFEIREGDLRF